jgi:DoxX-like protein
MRSPHRRLVAGLAVLQIADSVASTNPRMSATARLDHLGLPEVLRPVVPLIKLATSIGLLAGLRRPHFGMVASAALVAFYSAAVRFHRLAGDRPAFALPATALGASAAITLVRYFIPLAEGRSPAGSAAAGVKPRNRRAN